MRCKVFSVHSRLVFLENEHGIGDSAKQHSLDFLQHKWVGEAVDMHDFEVEELYFNEPLRKETQNCIDQAAKNYGKSGAEKNLLRAYFLEPEHPIVLVALYRFYYYQHRYADALEVAERVLRVYSIRLGLPSDWQDLTEHHFDQIDKQSMTDIRFYLLALKGAGYLEMRLENFKNALERLQKVVNVDSEDRMNAVSLLQTAEDEIYRQSGVYRLRF